MINWKTLIEESYNIAKEKGWHEEEKPLHEYMALVHSEISEVLEAFRRTGNYGMYTPVVKDTELLSGELWIRWDSQHADMIRGCCIDTKPEGVPSELADVVIRICDYLGDRGKLIVPLPGKYNEMAFTDFICHLHGLVSNAASPSGDETFTHFYLEEVINVILEFSDYTSINLEEAIQIKTDYNKTRTYKHGGKHL